MRRRSREATIAARLANFEPKPAEKRPLTAEQIEAMVACAKLGAISPEGNLHIARQVLGPSATDAEIEACAQEEFTESSDTVAMFGTEADLTEVKAKRHGLSPEVQTARCRAVLGGILGALCEGFPE